MENIKYSIYDVQGLLKKVEDFINYKKEKNEYMNTGYNSVIEYSSGSYKKKGYVNLAMFFDSETSMVPVIRDIHTRKVKQSHTNGIVQDYFAYVYFWTFAIALDDEICVIFARRVEEFYEFVCSLAKLFDCNENLLMQIYVHNLPYDYAFFSSFFEHVDVKANKPHAPYSASTINGIRFRDSYAYTRKNLDSVAKSLTKYNVKKLIGDLDYDKIRNDKTIISKKELQYGINDVLVGIALILEEKEEYHYISKIPNTGTAVVRQSLHERFYSLEYVSKRMRDLTKKVMKKVLILDLESLLFMKNAFYGGFTHANVLHVGDVLTDVVSMDFTSSYPAVICSELFPMSTGKWNYDMTLEQLLNLEKEQKGAITKVRFTNIRKKEDVYDCPISSSTDDEKCKVSKDVKENNGRLISASWCETTITNIDLELYNKAYEWDSVVIIKSLIFEMKPLPVQFISTVCEWYEKKTKLKGVKGFEREYMRLKEQLNSLFGMMVTDILRDEITFEEYEWKIKNLTKEDLEKKVEEYNNNGKRCTYYPWGLFVTAYARRNLWSAILYLKNDYIYSDTDSVKFLNQEKHKEYFEEYNRNIDEKIKKIMLYYDLDYNMTRPKTIDGISKPLGQWDFDGHYKRFKTLGSKRYMVEKDNGDYEITIAGLNKKAGLKYMLEESKRQKIDIFDFFNNNMVIPTGETGKKTHKYYDFKDVECKEVEITDFQGNKSNMYSPSYITLTDAPFTLSLSDQFLNLLTDISNGYFIEGYFD